MSLNFGILKQALLLCFCIVLGLFFVPRTAHAAGEFITTWKTDNAGTSANNQITIPTTGVGYSFDVDWGDASSTLGVTTTITHSYDIPGTYTVTVSGTFPRIYFNNEGDKLKILSVEQWGTGEWDYMFAAFSGCSNLVINAVDSPDLSHVTTASNMFNSATSMNSDLNDWDVSNITDMGGMFYNATSFNGDISDWDVSNATTLSGMFGGASAFNQDISNWDVSNVTGMYAMFAEATLFNQDISSWDVSNVTSLSYMFRNSAFNQDISSWDVSNVTSMVSMFNGSDFNQPLNSWDVSQVTDMNTMFYEAPFNQPLNLWDVSSVTNMSSMFSQDTAFNQDIGDWDVSNVTDMSYMFYGTENFNQDIGDWDVSSVVNMNFMFSDLDDFNQDLSAWDVSSVTNFGAMFADSPAFNQPLNSWNVSSATIMASMFRSATHFNQPLNTWDVSHVTNFGFMFSSAFDFDQDISSWDVSASPNMFAMLSNAGLSTENYDALLRAWSELPLQRDVTFHATGIKYCSSDQRANIISTYNWTITDEGLDDCHSVVYTASTGGSIEGESSQSILDSANARSVTAVPSRGYRFVSWSDTVTANPRTDINITQNISVSAVFKKIAGAIVYYACRDSQAINYQKSGVNKPSLCIYADATSIISLPSVTSSPVSIPVITCSDALYPTAPIRLGANNDPAQVKLLQRYLNEYEHSNLGVDGVYDKEDENAVIAWQEKYASQILTPWGLTHGTGYVFTTSLKKLKELFSAQCQKENVPAPDAQPVFTPVLFTRDLQVGMSGDDVRALQQLLQVNPTGYFGPLTKTALIEYQISKNITPAFGYFGPLTRALFNNQ